MIEKGLQVISLFVARFKPREQSRITAEKEMFDLWKEAYCQEIKNQ